MTGVECCMLRLYLKLSIRQLMPKGTVKSEKLLVAFKNPNSKKNPESSIFVRQFYAPGFYEAYDIVATHAEKLKLDILWFKEKRNCGYAYINNNYLQLESFCTYCNNKFNHIDPIPCIKEDCLAEFCSKECMMDH